jgi:sugar phosphate isomerase/epimerase
MKLAFSTISCPSYSIEQVADAAVRYGYDAVELYALDGVLLTPALLAERRGDIAAGLRSTPIACVNSATILAGADAGERRRKEDAILLAMESAASLGSPLVKAFGGDVPDGARASFFDQIAESIQRIAARGKELDVALVVETHDGFSRGKVLRELLDRVPEPHFGALWDMHHPFRMGEDPADTDRFIGDRVRHVHVKDARWSGEVWEYTALGSGEVPVRKVLGLLERRGFDGYVSLDWEKMWHPEIDGPEIALPQYREALLEYLHR